jgi:hypothetical protein
MVQTQIRKMTVKEDEWERGRERKVAYLPRQTEWNGTSASWNHKPKSGVKALLPSLRGFGKTFLLKSAVSSVILNTDSLAKSIRIL